MAPSMNQTDIEQAKRRLSFLMELAARYFSEEVGGEVAKLTPGERDIYLHLKDHIYTLTKSVHPAETPEARKDPLTFTETGGFHSVSCNVCGSALGKGLNLQAAETQGWDHLREKHPLLVLY